MQGHGHFPEGDRVAGMIFQAKVLVDLKGLRDMLPTSFGSICVVLNFAQIGKRRGKRSRFRPQDSFFDL